MYCTEDKEQQPKNPVLQIIQIKKLGGDENRSIKYRITLSDSYYYANTRLSIQLNRLIQENEIKNNSLVRINEYILNPTLDRKILIITSLTKISDLSSAIGNVSEFKNAQNSQRIDSQFAKSISPTQHSSLTPSSQEGPCTIPSDIIERETQRTQAELESNERFIPVNMLHPYLLTWSIKVRVVLRNSVVKYSNPRQDDGRLFSVILKDKFGYEIRGTFFGEQATKFDPIIQQDCVYKISDGIIKSKNNRFNTTNSDYEIMFDKRTKIESLSDDNSIGLLTYHFIPLNTIGTLPAKSLVDILCYVISIEPITEIVSSRTQKTFKRRTLIICDNSGVKCDISLWEEDALLFPNEGNFIISFKDAKISDYGRRSLICNSFYRINPKIPEAMILKDYIRSLGENNLMNLPSISISNYNINSLIYLSQINSNGIGTQNNKSEYYDLFILYTDINTQRKLYYNACPNPECKYKGLTLQGTNYYCERCTNLINEPKPRFNFSIKVQDHTGAMFMSILGDDNIGNLFVGKNANDWVNDINGHEDEENYIRQKLIQKFFQPMKLRCRFKLDNFMDQNRVKANVVAAEKLSFKEAALFYANEINKYFV
ncbi:DNA replication factor A subunit Ssb1 [Histomonas meleagridis]|uniref:DNA replication factor A subunit Ssb1 n=1 Tax=Histomonas meleagridis TaxID=135588 RepID=UPI00355A55F5|nr:DNA replication factor A subunit Ssb1 [Histomonas meleagridis]